MPKFLWILLMINSLGACRFTEGDTKVQYVPDMADAPTVKPQQGFLMPPEGAVATNAILYPKDEATAEQLLVNPYPHSPRTVEKGKEAYETFCIACHGADGSGKNDLGESYPPPPDLTDPIYDGREDGWYFYKITYGGALMPKYGHAIDFDERWMLVHYLKELQMKDRK